MSQARADGVGAVDQDLAGERLDVAVGGAGGDDHQVGEARFLAHVEHADLHALHFFEGGDDDFFQFFGRQHVVGGFPGVVPAEVQVPDGAAAGR